MTDDLISRQMAIDRFENLSYDDWNQGVSTTWANAFAECAEIISELPTAERKGHWILQEDITKKLYGWHICSECGAWIGEPANFCSECGADMRGDTDGREM